MFWMPDQVRHDELGLFTRPSTLFQTLMPTVLC
jgi:hypothetical protein